MPDAARIVGKLGRLPVKPEGKRFAIKWLSDYLAPPAPSYPIDVSKGITAWGMLANGPDPTLDKPPAGVDPNQGVGDCGPVAYAHDRMLAGAHPTADEVVALYWIYDEGQDDGVNLADFLLWLFHQGLIEGFAPVELRTVDAVMAQLKRGVILGVNLTDADMDAFNNGQPWSATSPDPQNGHAILKVKAEQNGDGTIVTWGADQKFTSAWSNACVEEAWALVTKDDIGDAAYAALLSDLRALPHADVVTPPAPTPVPPSPSPQPQPAPAPAPAPGAACFPGASSAVNTHVLHASALAHEEPAAWMNHHFGWYFHITP